MMLLVRSVFWLTVAYMVIKPGVELPDAAALSAQAVTAGTRVVAEQIQSIPCDSLQCIGGKAVLSATIAKPAPTIPSAALFPLPRPRPGAAS